MEKIEKNIPTQIEVKFTTNLPEEFHLQSENMNIPTKMKSADLNNLLKKLIQNEKEFVFFINEKSLGSLSISEFITAESKINEKFSSSIFEKGLEILYAFALDQPEQFKSIKEDEWIRKIKVRNNEQNFNNLEYYCVGLFNSEISIYNRQFDKILKISPDNLDKSNEELLNDLLFLKNPNTETYSTIVKASRDYMTDRNLKFYQVDLNKGSFTQDYYSTEKINCLSLNPVDYNQFIGGTENGDIKLFNLTDYFIKVSNSNKKRKTETSEINSESLLKNCHGDSNLEITSEIKNLKWLNNQQILTTGEDFYIKLWNLHTKSLYSTFNTNYKHTTCFNTISNNTVLVTGHEDGSIKIWDLKNNTNSKHKNISNAHKYLVSNIETHPSLGGNYFTSSGYDGLVKIWDTRALDKPVFEISSDNEKIFGLTFNSGDYSLIGGDSSNLTIYSHKS